jgi:hypothetical protein
MPECERCGAFTDNRRSGEYHYCSDCTETFDEIRQNGVVVKGDGKYDILVNVDGHREKGGQEFSQTDALARGKLIADELGVDALFEYDESGSSWLIEEYLTAHPGIQSDVSRRLGRVPNDESGLLAKLRNLFG